MMLYWLSSAAHTECFPQWLCIATPVCVTSAVQHCLVQ